MKFATITNPALNPAYGTPGGSGGAPDRIEKILTITIGAITVFGFIYFIFQIFMGAVQWITAGSDKRRASILPASRNWAPSPLCSRPLEPA